MRTARRRGDNDKIPVPGTTNLAVDIAVGRQRSHSPRLSRRPAPPERDSGPHADQDAHPRLELGEIALERGEIEMVDRLVRASAFASTAGRVWLVVETFSASSSGNLM